MSIIIKNMKNYADQICNYNKVQNITFFGEIQRKYKRKKNREKYT